MARTSRSPRRPVPEGAGPAATEALLPERSAADADAATTAVVSATSEPGRSLAARGAARRRLAVASAAVLLAAADTYVVVLALPDIMRDVGIGIDQLQRAAPIVSGFLLGYVVVLPLLGRLSDLYGRRPVFLGCLATFAVGSTLTATSEGLPLVVAGRTLQGLGGGGLVPVTLALVADHWPPERRGVPLGIVGAVQELGSVLGPLYGAVVVAASGWRTIFWINLPLSAILGIVFSVGPMPVPTSGVSRGREQDASTGPLASAGPRPGPAPASAPSRGPSETRLGSERPRSPHHADVVGLLLLAVAATLGGFALTQPAFIADSDTFGQLTAPIRPGPWGALATPVALGCFAAVVGFVLWETAAPLGISPLLPLRRLPEVLRAADWPGAALLGGVLAGVILAFATADPSHQVIADDWPIVLGATALFAALFVVRELRCPDPLVDLGAFAAPGAFGPLVVNLFVGAALMAALVDIPIFARTTQYPNSQVGAALVLVRLLAAIPIGAVVGGVLCDRLGNRLVAAAGLLLTAGVLAEMATWSASSLADPLVVLGHRTPLHTTDLWLGAAGLGFGLCIAPINASLLAAVQPSLHGLASALVVVARMVGMLVGLSLLTAIGLHRFYVAAARIPPPDRLCPTHPIPGQCPPYDTMVTNAALDELHVIFVGASLSATIAALLAAILLERRGTRRVGLVASLVGTEA
jgi:MFS family permease